MRTINIVAAIRAAKDRQEVRLKRTTALRDHKTEGSGRTTCKANQAPTTATMAEVGVEAGEGDSELCKDCKPRLDDAPSGYTG